MKTDRKEAVIILFAKAPEPGKVKSRLRPALSREGAARLQEAFILDTLHLTDPLACDRAIACFPSPAHPFFVRCAKERSLALIQQEGDDLGARMRNAFRWGFSERYRKVILIGCDAPTLPAEFILEGLTALDRDPWTLGPSRDGGYYLIGSSALGADLFDGIAWGTDQVLTETLARLNETGLRCHLLPFWYDVDRPEDLRFLKRDLQNLEAAGREVPKETSQIVQNFKPFAPPKGPSA